MSDVSVISAKDCSPAELDSFLRSYFTAEKCDFLRDYGDWQHHGNENRFLIRKDGRIAAYCAVMPTEIWVGEVLPAFWLIDIYVHPDFRGQGLQRILDEQVTALGLVLGVPNAAAAQIHRKHGWGVREDFSVMLLPLKPSAMPSVRRQKPIFRQVAKVLEPFTQLYAMYLQRQQSSAYELHSPEALAKVYARYRGVYTETERNLDYLKWRFFDSPYQSEYRYWGIDGTDGLEIALISREVRGCLRILDIFGNLANHAALHELILKAIQSHSACLQVTGIASNPHIKAALRRVGMLPVGKFRFCWISPDAGLMQKLARCDFHWVLADSDSDLV